MVGVPPFFAGSHLLQPGDLAAQLDQIEPYILEATADRAGLGVAVVGRRRDPSIRQPATRCQPAAERGARGHGTADELDGRGSQHRD